ncbi:SDR family oxidoreductase [Falsibacillus albus]|uniref:SDR family NAD(P)-dependent oxidoreductase n=1 Tax=Falsibacillus albus TaxID=2478915 RepID=A0A3L7JTY0_9BACI|nr:SDR family NAD(P)-dependent oxidoreductase [Falsibacillus albus]RLQ94337.1 SDR family NAD(P)-dependent oxidoreductase [Falsibacillus albus]
MKISGNTVLITGGGSGIGMALAERFLETDNNVIIVGRREEKLKEAKERFPQLHYRVCDVSKESNRISLCEWAVSEFPDLNILINNAGIQQRINLLKPQQDWDYYQKEISINVGGPIHLTMLLLPHLMKKENAAILNVSSGLSITPGAWVPIYSATKAALHSFTRSLRLQLEDTNVNVIEVLPPAVNTDLGGVGLHTFGAPLDDFANSVFSEIREGKNEIGYGDSKKRLRATRDEIDEGMMQAWKGFLNRNPDFKE